MPTGLFVCRPSIAAYILYSMGIFSPLPLRIMCEPPKDADPSVDTCLLRGSTTKRLAFASLCGWAVCRSLATSYTRSADDNPFEPHCLARIDLQRVCGLSKYTVLIKSRVGVSCLCVQVDRRLPLTSLQGADDARRQMLRDVAELGGSLSSLPPPSPQLQSLESKSLSAWSVDVLAPIHKHFTGSKMLQVYSDSAKLMSLANDADPATLKSLLQVKSRQPKSLATPASL